MANGVSQADIDFLTWNDGDQRSYRTAKPCRGSRDDVGESKEECKSWAALGFVGRIKQHAALPRRLGGPARRARLFVDQAASTSSMEDGPPHCARRSATPTNVAPSARSLTHERSRQEPS